MATTTNYGLTKPTVGASENTWGDSLNTDMDLIDTQMKASADVAAAALPKAGGALTGPVTTTSTVDGVDISARDAVLTSTTTTANAALPKAGGTMTGVIAGFESTGIDDNATSTAITIDSSENVGIGTSSPNGNGILTLNTPADNSAQIVFAENDTAKWLVGHRHDGDYFRFYDLSNSAERLRINSNGRISTFGSSNSNAALNLVGEGGNSFKCLSFERTGGGGEVGNIIANASSTSYNTSSDYRLKEHMRVIEDDFILSVMHSMQVYTGNFISDPDETLGMYKAQEVYEQLPNVTSGTPDETEEYEVAPALGESYIAAHSIPLTETITNIYINLAGEEVVEQSERQITEEQTSTVIVRKVVDGVDREVEKAITEVAPVLIDVNEEVIASDIPESEIEEGTQWRETSPAVKGTRPVYMGMDHSKIVPYLHAYTQALHRRIEELEKRL